MNLCVLGEVGVLNPPLVRTSASLRTNGGYFGSRFVLRPYRARSKKYEGGRSYE